MNAVAMVFRCAAHQDVDHPGTQAMIPTQRPYFEVDDRGPNLPVSDEGATDPICW